MGCTTAQAQRLMELPLSEMTYPEIAEALGVERDAAVRFVRTLRDKGLVTAFVKSTRKDNRGAAVEARRAREVSKWQAEVVARNELADTRTELCPATWDVYAAVLSPEDMTRWFRLKGRTA